MGAIRRLALVISIVFCGSLAWAAAAVAAGGGGIGPGNYVFKDTIAAAQFGFPNDPKQGGFDVFVNRGLNSFQLAEPKDSPPVVSQSTIVNLDIFGPKGFGSFCFVLNNPADFTVNADLKSASLHTLLTAGEMCNFGGPVAGKAGATPRAGGGGPTLQPPFQVDITWTATGVRGSGQDRNTFTCGSYSSLGTTVTKTAGQNVTGTISVLGGSFESSTGGLIANTTNLNIKGSPQPGCFGF